MTANLGRTKLVVEDLAMECPKCAHELKRFATLRSQKLSCPECGARLEPAPMRAPFLMILLAMLPVQLTNLFRSYQSWPGPVGLAVIGAMYLAAWAGLIVLAGREIRGPRLRERLRPRPETVLNLHFEQNGGSPP